LLRPVPAKTSGKGEGFATNRQETRPNDLAILIFVFFLSNHVIIQAKKRIALSVAKAFSLLLLSSAWIIITHELKAMFSGM
jgi:prophage maintenance system killer protein